MKTTLWGRFNRLGNGFIFEPYNRARLLDFGREMRGQEVKVEITDKEKPKSAELLGYYWGGILPSIVAHNKNIPFHPISLGDLIKEGKVTRAEIEEMHDTLMTEFRPKMVKDLKGLQTKQRGEMKDMNNAQASLYINDVIEWAVTNGYKIPDPEDYKAYMNSAPLIHNEDWPPMVNRLWLAHVILQPSNRSHY